MISISNECYSFQLSICLRILKKKKYVSTKYKAAQLFSKLIIMCFDNQISLLECFLNDHETLNTGVMAAGNLSVPEINYILKYIQISYFK